MLLLRTNHPKSGAHVMTNETSHTTSIMSDANLFDLLFFEYRNGLVMAKYLSIDIAQRLSMDAVHRHTSSDTQMSHTSGPKVQVPESHTHTHTSYSETDRCSSRASGVRITNFARSFVIFSRILFDFRFLNVGDPVPLADNCDWSAQQVSESSIYTLPETVDRKNMEVRASDRSG